LSQHSADARHRAAAPRHHHVLRTFGYCLLTLTVGMMLFVSYTVRTLTANVSVQDIGFLTDRPVKEKVEGPRAPLNILVMGSDSREGKNNIDGLTGGGQRSDTTILLHLSADRKRAYGISIPRDSMVDRPDCKAPDGSAIPGADNVMWNEAFGLGGPACTIQQFEQLTGVHLDHFVVVNFEGFQGMVDAIGGVEVCIPEPIVDPKHGINIEAGTRKIKGKEALNYVRERYVVGNGSDIGRMKRQQAFIASMAHQVVTAGTLARPDRLVRFLDSATKSLTVDPGLKNVVKIAELGIQFKGIGLDKIQFITTPNMPDPADPNRLVWTPAAKDVWRKIARDEPLTKRLSEGVISAGNLPGSGSPGSSANSPSGPDSNEADKQELEDAGLCT
jgi:LCP family protein required for cell wall assembly